MSLVHLKRCVLFKQVKNGTALLTHINFGIILIIDFTKSCHENNRETVKPNVSDFVETVKKLKPASTSIISPLSIPICKFYFEDYILPGGFLDLKWQMIFFHEPCFNVSSKTISRFQC